MKTSTIAWITVGACIINGDYKIHLHTALQEIDECILRFYVFFNERYRRFFVELPDLTLLDVVRCCLKRSFCGLQISFITE